MADNDQRTRGRRSRSSAGNSRGSAATRIDSLLARRTWRLSDEALLFCQDQKQTGSPVQLKYAHEFFDLTRYSCDGVPSGSQPDFGGSHDWSGRIFWLDSLPI